MFSFQDLWLHLQRSFFQIGSHSQDPGIRMWAYLLGNHHSTHCSRIDYRWTQQDPPGFPQGSGITTTCSQQDRPSRIPPGAELLPALRIQTLGIKAGQQGCNQRKLPGRSGKLMDGISDLLKRGKEERELYTEDVACVHTLDKRGWDVCWGKLRKTCMERKEGRREGEGEREPVLEGLGSETSFS